MISMLVMTPLDTFAFAFAPIPSPSITISTLKKFFGEDVSKKRNEKHVKY